MSTMHLPNTATGNMQSSAGVGAIVERLTDNRNRRASDVRRTFTKNDGNLGGSGAVSWLFERRGVVLVPADGVAEEEFTFFFQAEDGIRDLTVTGVQTCALPI